MPRPVTAVSDLSGRFASCVAYLTLTASVAERQGDVMAAYRLGRLAQGWRAAGYAIVRNSTDPQQTAQDEADFDSLVIQLFDRQNLELGSDPQRAMDLMSRTFDQTCRPLAPLQGRLIEMMRERPVTALDNQVRSTA